MPTPAPHPDPAPKPGVAIAPGVRVPAEALRFSFSSSSGPGGQNVNKRATKAELRVRLFDLPITAAARHRLADLAGHRLVDDAEVVITRDTTRSQEQNKSACLDRLRELIVRAMVAPKVRRATKPGRGARERRLTEKKVRGSIKASRSRGAKDSGE